MKALLATALFFTGACAPNQEATLESVALSREHFSWYCKDYENHTELIVETTTCEDIDTGLHFLIAEYTLYNDTSFKRHLQEDEDCHYSTEFFLVDEVCISVNDVTLTALVEIPSWEGVFFDD